MQGASQGSAARTSGGDAMSSAVGVAGTEERWFFSGMAVLAAAVVFTGFAPSYYLKGAFGTPALSPLLHVHGALFTSWILLLVTQTMLVAAGRTNVHRRLGVAGGVLAATMTVLAVMVAVDSARRGIEVSEREALSFLVVGMGTALVFPVLIGAALLLRGQPDAHKRLMLIGTAELVTAGVGRLPLVSSGGPLAFFGVTDLFIVVLWTYDYLTRGRVHRAALWGGLFFIASQPLRMAIGGTDAWFAFATWLTR